MEADRAAMSAIYICNLIGACQHATLIGAAHMVSLLGDDPFPETPAGIAPGRHLRLRIHDIDEPVEGYQAPELHHIERLIEWGAGWLREEALVVHCFAGVSRSTAAALTLLAQANPGHEDAAARLLRERAPHAKPNRRMIALADRALGLEGRLSNAVAAMGEPDFATMGAVVELPVTFG